MTSRGIKGFYRQQKKGVGVSKPTRGSTNFKRRSTSPTGPEPLRYPALAHGKHDVEGEEEDDHSAAEEGVLRHFDLDTKYGPCLGISRLERWERARCMGLNPPPEVAATLQRSSAKGECLWQGCV